VANGCEGGMALWAWGILIFVVVALLLPTWSPVFDVFDVVVVVVYFVSLPSTFRSLARFRFASVSLPIFKLLLNIHSWVFFNGGVVGLDNHKKYFRLSYTTIKKTPPYQCTSLRPGFR